MRKLEKRIMELEAEVKELRKQLLDLSLRTPFIYYTLQVPYTPPITVPTYPTYPGLPYYTNPIVTCGTTTTTNGLMDIQVNQNIA